MFAEEMKKLVKQAIEEETKNAVEKFGQSYNSMHEGYAVLLEEVEEADDKLKAITFHLDVFWRMVKHNEEKAGKKTIALLANNAEQLALEACQIAAVCNKIQNTLVEEK